ncbi:unnamed protein product [Penicillium glandicola]
MRTTPQEASSHVPPTSIFHTGKAISPVKPKFTSKDPRPLYGGANVIGNFSQKRKEPIDAAPSATCKRVKREAPILKGPEATLPTQPPTNSRHGKYDDIEWCNSVLKDAATHRLENSNALVAVYERILETIARMDLDIRSLENAMVEHGYISESVVEDDDAEEEVKSEGASEQSLS